MARERTSGMGNRHDARLRRLERRLRDETPQALTPAPASLRSRVMSEVWETTPERPAVLMRIGRPALAAAALIALTAGGLLALSTLTTRSGGQGAAAGGEPAILALLDQARSLGTRLPALPEGVGMGAEAERVLADARRAAQRFGERLVPVRTVFLGERAVESPATPRETPGDPAPEQSSG